MTVTVAGNTPTGTFPVTVTGNGGGIQQNTAVTLTVTGQSLNTAYFEQAYSSPCSLVSAHHLTPIS